MEANGFKKRFGQFLDRVNEKAQESYAAFAKGFVNPSKFQIEAMEGKRYIRLVRVEFVNGVQNGRAAFGFVDKTNGDVLKADGWKGPAKNFARGNIFKDDFGVSRANWCSIQ